MCPGIGQLPGDKFSNVCLSLWCWRMCPGIGRLAGGPRAASRSPRLRHPAGRTGGNATSLSRFRLTTTSCRRLLARCLHLSAADYPPSAQYRATFSILLAAFKTVQMMKSICTATRSQKTTLTNTNAAAEEVDHCQLRNLLFNSEARILSLTGNSNDESSDGWIPRRSIRSAERREEARIRLHGRRRKAQPRRTRVCAGPAG